MSNVLAEASRSSSGTINESAPMHATAALVPAAVGSQSNQKLFGRILVAVASGEPAQWAAETAGRLASEGGRQVALLHVIDPRLLGTTASELGLAVSHRYTEVLADGKTSLDAALAHFPTGVVVEQMIRDGETVPTILDVAKQWRADLIVMGTHVHNRFTDLLLGSTAAAVVRRAPTPVLVIGHQPSANR